MAALLVVSYLESILATKRMTDKDELIDELIAAFRDSGNQDDAIDNLAAKRLGVNRTDLQCLNAIENAGGLTAGELAVAAGLTTRAVTGVGDRPQRAGHAPRARGLRPARRRSVGSPARQARGHAGVLRARRRDLGADGRRLARGAASLHARGPRAAARGPAGDHRGRQAPPRSSDALKFSRRCAAASWRPARGRAGSSSGSARPSASAGRPSC